MSSNLNSKRLGSHGAHPMFTPYNCLGEGFSQKLVNVQGVYLDGFFDIYYKVADPLRY